MSSGTKISIKIVFTVTEIIAGDMFKIVLVTTYVQT